MTGRRPPATLTAHARQEGLGSPLDGWAGRTVRHTPDLRVPIGSGCFAALSWTVDRLWAVGPHATGVALAVLAGCLALADAVRGWRDGRHVVWVFEGGIVTRTGGGVTTLRFRDLTDVRESQRTGPRTDDGGQPPTVRTVELVVGGDVVQRYQGTVGTHEDRIGAAAVMAFHRQTTRRVREGVAAGRAVGLGAFTVSAEGLHHRDGLLPWSTFQQVRVAQGSVFFVHRWGGNVVYPFDAVRGGSAALAVVAEAHRARSG